MKISKDALKGLINETLTKLISESDSDINWENLNYLNKKGGLSRLSPKWQVLVLARELAKGDIERTLAILKAAVATLEAKKTQGLSRQAQAPSPEDGGDLDFASLVTGGKK